MVVKSSNEEGLYIFSYFNCFQPSKKDLNLKAIKSSKNEDSDYESDHFYSKYNKVNDIKFGVNLEACKIFLDTKISNLKQYWDFYVLIKLLQIDILERNEDSFLSAGEIPGPTLYLTWSIIYFLAAISWSYILKSSK